MNDYMPEVECQDCMWQGFVEELLESDIEDSFDTCPKCGKKNIDDFENDEED